MAVAFTQELLDKATAYVGQPLSARRYDEGLSEITALYAEITGEPASKCRQCQYSNYLAVVQAYIRQATRELHPETMAESKYTLAPGQENETFVHEGYGQAVTAENLTDEAAEFFISKGFKNSFVLKPGHEAASKTEGDKSDTDPKASAGETKAKADLAAEKTAHKTTKDALKAEKQVTSNLTKERDQLAQQLADANEKLAKNQQDAEAQGAHKVDPAAAS